MIRFLFLFALFMVAVRAAAGELPAFESDAAADRWLRAHSPSYRRMATQIDNRGGYSFQGTDHLSMGMVGWKDGKPVIELANTLTGAKRVSILIFTLADIYESPQHKEIDDDAAEGRIASEREFTVLHVLVQLDGLRHHRDVLEDIDRQVEGVPAEMLRWINPRLNKLSDYLLPMAYQFVKAQEAGANARYYHEWFYKQARAR
jgi:hypothetical protein